MKFKEHVTKKKIMKEYSGNIEASPYDEMKRDGSGEIEHLTLYYKMENTLEHEQMESDGSFSVF